MTKIEIETGIPMPPAKARKGKSKYPIYELKVGESFFVTGVTRGAVYAIAARTTKSTDKTFSCRTVEKDGVKGCRIWRVK